MPEEALFLGHVKPRLSMRQVDTSSGTRRRPDHHLSLDGIHFQSLEGGRTAAGTEAPSAEFCVTVPSRLGPPLLSQGRIGFR